jgi:ring-1,2-phenylacetyl-CoA epoxidase subunit PaaD
MVSEKEIWSLLEEVNDPEVPVLSVVDLGIVREVNIGQPGAGGDEIGIVITPTYNGCPAMDMIRTIIRMKLLEHGYPDVRLTTVLSPAWTTDWMSEKGKEKLLQYGIAPPLPVQQVCHPGLFRMQEAISCPRCHSYHTERISEFGSTACKSLYRCKDCGEPFDYFKCH